MAPMKAVLSLAGTKPAYQLPSDFPLLYSLLMDVPMLLAFICSMSKKSRRPQGWFHCSKERKEKGK